MKYAFVFALLLSVQAFADEDCQNLPPIAGESVMALSRDVLQSSQQLYSKVVDLRVRLAGSGDLSVLLNDEGEVEAVRFNYRDKKDVKVLNITARELNQGLLLEYPAQNGAISPLKLSVVRPPGLNPSTGGTFKLEIATSLDPAKFTSYQIRLAKTGTAWGVSQGSSRVKEVVIHPGVSMLSWDGTFQKIEFKN
ncbi:MAG: hypothetical protein ACLGG7_13875 [Bacteriovoracia bacterium]